MNLIIFADQAEEIHFNLQFLNKQNEFNATILYLNRWDKVIMQSHQSFFPNCKIIFLEDILEHESSSLINLHPPFVLHNTQENVGFLHGRYYNDEKIDEKSLAKELQTVLAYLLENTSDATYLFLGRHGTMRSLVYNELIKLSRSVYSISYSLVENMILFTHDYDNYIRYIGVDGDIRISVDDEPSLEQKVISQRQLETKKNLSKGNIIFIILSSLFLHLRGCIYSCRVAISNRRWRHALNVVRSYFGWIMQTILINIARQSFSKRYNKIKKEYKKLNFIFLHVFPEATTFDEFLEYPSEIFYINEYGLFEIDKANLFIDHPAMRISGERSVSLRKIYQSLPNSFFFDAPTLSGFPMELLNDANAVHSLCGSVAIEAVEADAEVFIYARHPLELLKGINSRYRGPKVYAQGQQTHVGSLSLESYQSIMKKNAATTDSIILLMRAIKQ